MSGSSFLPVGGAASVADLKVALGNLHGHILHGVVGGLAHSTTRTWLIGSINTATIGYYMPYACIVKRVTGSGNCTAQSGTPTVTLTAWKTNQSAGSEIINATSAATATNVGLDWSSTTLVNGAGIATFAAGDRLLLSTVCTATSCSLSSFIAIVEWDWI